MSSVPDFESTAPGGLFGGLRTWLRARSSELRDASGSAPAEPGALTAHQARPVCVLVVDDNPVNLMLMSALMESRGLVVILAADGAEAVALSCELHFDLILMDLQMPILDGFGAAQQIRRFENSTSRPAVPLLAYSSATPGANVLARHGMNGSLAKPCADQDLEDCLIRWCPTYRPAAPLHGVAHVHAHWQTDRRSPGASPVSAR